MDRPAINETELSAREKLVTLAKEMIDGELSYFEGAQKVLALKKSIGGVTDKDPDFNAFVAISSETDHLPLKAQRHLWSPLTLAALEEEFEKTEQWASEFAHKACHNLIGRFSETANQ